MTAFPKPTRAKPPLPPGRHRRKGLKRTRFKARRQGASTRQPAASPTKLIGASPRRALKHTPAPHAGRLAWIHFEPCSALKLRGHRCSGPMTANHQREGVGVGLKAGHDRTHPLCSEAHTGNGMANLGEAFKGMDRDRLRAFVAESIAETDARWAAYRAFARALPCAAGALSACEGDVGAEAAGFPLCLGHASAWAFKRGPFRDWGVDRARAWRDAKLSWATQAWRDGVVTVAPPVSADEIRALVLVSRTYCDPAGSWCREGCDHEQARKWLQQNPESVRRAS